MERSFNNSDVEDAKEEEEEEEEEQMEQRDKELGVMLTSMPSVVDGLEAVDGLNVVDGGFGSSASVVVVTSGPFDASGAFDVDEGALDGVFNAHGDFMDAHGNLIGDFVDANGALSFDGLQFLPPPPYQSPNLIIEVFCFS